MAERPRRRLARIPGVVVGLGCIALTGVASAAALNGLGTSLLGAGTAAVAACDADGFSISHVLAGTTVTDVVVSGIHADCSGGALTVTLTDAADAEVASGGPVTVLGAAATVAIVPSVDASAFTNHHIRIMGP